MIPFAVSARDGHHELGLWNWYLGYTLAHVIVIAMNVKRVNLAWFLSNYENKHDSISRSDYILADRGSG